MKRCSTIFLRFAIFVAGAIVLALCIGALWLSVKANPTSDYVIWARVFFGGTCLAAIPFFIALYQSFKLLEYIDANRAFSVLSEKALRIITRAAFAEFLICALGGLPFAYIIADMDDAPGIILIALAIAGVAFVIFVFAFVLNRLLQDAIAMKAENDLK